MSFILASGSASRRSLLTNAGVEFEVDPADVDEGALKEMFDGGPSDLALHLAKAKALAVSTRREGLILGADQVLEFDGKAYDKARSTDEASERLKMLRGGVHYLQGGVVLARGDTIVWEHKSSAKLTMRTWSDAFHERYMAEAGDILTKGVGAYAFEGLGAQLFQSVEGDFFSILGLPLLPVLDALREQGVLTP
ncbi:Maf family protein [Maricaulaceae bacterium EIL42A08]|nr:Maf family protein [Maricaulaceae bacterium EIL42A08]